MVIISYTVAIYIIYIYIYIYAEGKGEKKYMECNKNVLEKWYYELYEKVKIIVIYCSCKYVIIFCLTVGDKVPYIYKLTIYSIN